MRFLFDILKGILIGVANVIPGFSGGTMAVILKVYDRLIEGLSKLIHHPIMVIKDLWAIGIGMVIGVIGSIFSIVLLLEHFPIPTIMFFVGLIIGSIPSIFNEANENKPSKINYLWLILAICFIVALPFIHLGETSSNLDFGKSMIVLIMGIISAAAMVIPGVSGSLTLMALGYYTFVMTNIKDLLSGLAHFDFANITNPFIITLVFGIGAVLGIIFISKLINLALKKNKACVYFIILGLLIGSPFSIIYKVCTSGEYNIEYKNPLIWIFGAITLIIGTALPIVLKIVSNKKKEEKLIEE